MEELKLKVLNSTLALALIFMIPLPTQAKVIALGSSNKVEDFKGYLVKNPGYTSLSSHLLNRQLNRNDHLLEEKYKLAVKGLILADLKPSVFLFKEITDFPNESYIFSDNKIELISNSFFRLANLDRENDDFWIKQALYYEPSYTPSNETFNPIIMKKYNRTKNELLSYFYNLDTDNIRPKWSKMYINSKEIKNFISIHPSSNYTLKVFRDGKQPYTSKVSGAELIKMSPPKLKNFNLGNCKNPTFYESNVKIEVDAIFFAKNCIVYKEEQQLLLADNTNDRMNDNTNDRMNDSTNDRMKPYGPYETHFQHFRHFKHFRHFRHFRHFQQSQSLCRFNFRFNFKCNSEYN